MAEPRFALPPAQPPSAGLMVEPRTADPSMAAPCIAARPSSPPAMAMVLPQPASRRVLLSGLRRAPLPLRPTIRHTATHHPTIRLPAGNAGFLSGRGQQCRQNRQEELRGGTDAKCSIRPGTEIDGCVLARRQLSLGRPDLPLR